jgi:hypothetical protein
MTDQTDPLAPLRGRGKYRRVSSEGIEWVYDGNDNPILRDFSAWPARAEAIAHALNAALAADEQLRAKDVEIAMLRNRLSAYWREGESAMLTRYGIKGTIWTNPSEDDDCWCRHADVAALEARLAEIEARRCETCKHSVPTVPVSETEVLCMKCYPIRRSKDHQGCAWAAKEERDG